SELLFNENHACPICGFSIDELEPRLFSFNSPFGACPTCDGLGTKLEVDLDLVVPDKNLSLNEHAIEAWKPISSQYYPQLFKTVTKREFNKIFYGSGDEKIHFHYVNDFGREHKNDIKFEGVMNNIKRRYHETSSDFIRETLEEYMAESDCPSCHGYRLKDEALSVLINGKHISALTEFSIVEAKEFFDTLELTKKENEIATMILKEIND